jgi:hypothetical protein
MTLTFPNYARVVVRKVAAVLVAGTNIGFFAYKGV